jgi:hypothetical protein
VKKVLAWFTLVTMACGLIAAGYGAVTELISVDRRIEAKAEKDLVLRMEKNLTRKIHKIGLGMCKVHPDTCDIVEQGGPNGP